MEEVEEEEVDAAAVKEECREEVEEENEGVMVLGVRGVLGGNAEWAEGRGGARGVSLWPLLRGGRGGSSASAESSIQDREEGTAETATEEEKEGKEEGGGRGGRRGEEEGGSSCC